MEKIDDNGKQGNKKHDALFISAMSDFRVVKDFFQQYLPQPLISALDLTALEICKDKFIDDNLKSKITDMLYRVKFNDGREAYLSVLVEHQSTASREMPLRVLQYECAVMRQSLINYGIVPLVYTVVYYNGKVRWPYPTDIKELIDAPKDLVEQYALTPFQLVDLNEIDDATLRRHLWSGVMSQVMKHIYERDVLPTFEQILQALKQIEGLHGHDFIKAVLYYIYTQGEVSDEEKFKHLIKDNFSQETRRGFMTLAEKRAQELLEGREQELISQGIQKGIEEGIKEGRIIDAKKMLAKGFDTRLIAEITGIDITTLNQLKESESKY